jgi:hypothetical protein
LAKGYQEFTLVYEQRIDKQLAYLLPEHENRTGVLARIYFENGFYLQSVLVRRIANKVFSLVELARPNVVRSSRMKYDLAPAVEDNELIHVKVDSVANDFEYVVYAITIRAEAVRHIKRKGLGFEMGDNRIG